MFVSAQARNTHAEASAGLVAAEAELVSANQALRAAEENRAMASAAWERIQVDQRKAGADRRKSGVAWDQIFPDRRKANFDRRIPQTETDVLIKRVAQRHQAYLDKIDAEACWSKATARVSKAFVELDKAAALRSTVALLPHRNLATTLAISLTRYIAPAVAA